VICSLPSLAAHDGQPGGPDEQSIVIQVVAPTRPADGRIVNEVDVSADNEPFENTGNNHAVEETVVLGQRPDLTVEKTGAPSFLSFESVERTVTYTVTVRNTGPVAATGVELRDTLPPSDQAAFVSASAGCTHAAGVVTCPLANLAAGGETSVTIAVTVPATTQDLLLRNEARVSATNEGVWNEGNNLAVEHTPVIAPPPVLTVVKSGPESVLRAREFNYTVTVANSGGGDALDVVLTDVLPDSLTFLSGDGAACSLAPDNVVTCTIPQVPANDGQVDGQVVITINVRAPTVLGTGDLSLTNEVTVVDPDENLELSDSEATLIQACFDITGDGAVAFADVLALLVVFGSSITDQQSQEKLTIIDFNGDGSISFLDFLQLVQHYGQVC
jgi:uncharacterized repeat protein (TIGR01451 family)